MKRFSIGVFFLVFFIVHNPAFARSSAASAYDSRLPRVVDEAGLLSGGEKAELEKRINAIREQYAFDLVIVTVFSTGGKSAEAFADDYYDYAGYGVGPDADGALLLQVIDERYLHLSGTGRGIEIFNYRRINNTLDKIIPDLQQDNYYFAYWNFLNQAEQYLAGAGQEKLMTKIVMYLVAAALALILSLVTFFNYRSRHKTIGESQQFARDYFIEESLNFSSRNDAFVSTFTSGSRLAQSNTIPRGIHTGSSGRRHSGGGRRY